METFDFDQHVLETMRYLACLYASAPSPEPYPDGVPDPGEWDNAKAALFMADLATPAPWSAHQVQKAGL